MIAPPVTLQTTATLPVSLLAVRPTAMRSVVWFGRSVKSFGRTMSLVTALGPVGPVTASGFPQAVSATTVTTHNALSRASRWDSLCKNVIRSSLWFCARLRPCGRHRQVVHPHRLVDGRPRSDVRCDHQLVELHVGVRT